MESLLHYSVPEANKNGLEAWLADIEDVSLSPLQASITNLTGEVAARDASLAEQRKSHTSVLHCSVLETDKHGLEAQLADIEEVRIAPLQTSIEGLTQDIAARDTSLAEQQSRIAELAAQVADVEQRLELKRSKKQAYKQAFAGKVRQCDVQLRVFGQCHTGFVKNSCWLQQFIPLHLHISVTSLRNPCCVHSTLS